jgi:hypothetical protein
MPPFTTVRDTALCCDRAQLGDVVEQPGALAGNVGVQVQAELVDQVEPHKRPSQGRLMPCSCHCRAGFQISRGARSLRRFARRCAG